VYKWAQLLYCKKSPKYLNTSFKTIFSSIILLLLSVVHAVVATAADNDAIAFYFTFAKNLQGATFHRLVSYSPKTLYF
jgi:hypothetical protein